jgi:nitroreductase
MKEIIFKRKSTRNFDMSALDAAALADIQRFADSVRPLYDDIRIKFAVRDKKSVKGLTNVRAPHYLALSSEKKDGYLTNAGFAMQQLDLYLQGLGFGCCWLGGAKCADDDAGALAFVIALAFGKPLQTPYREITDFKRKPLSEISDTRDERLESARLAPSAVNSQPWYFVGDGGAFHVYCKKLGAIKGLVYERLNKIDIGIALAHLYVSGGGGFRFFTAEQPKQLDGYYYIGSAQL